jgi:hypothetical protein
MSRSVGELMIAARRELEGRENKLADQYAVSSCCMGLSVMSLMGW